MAQPGDRPAPGLRERKKAKVRVSIQREALRLFRKQGYDATTVEQIAAGAEVSPSTFFRYFPAKQDVILSDDFDPLFAAAFREQPADLGVVPALRRSVHAVLGPLSAKDRDDLRERSVMIFEVPELWAAALAQFSQTMTMLAELAAERLGRSADDREVRALAGAIVGVLISVVSQWAEQPDVDIPTSIDDALAFLEAGLPLGTASRPAAAKPAKRPAQRRQRG